MKAVKQIIQQFLRIVLLIPDEGLLEVSQGAFQSEGAEDVARLVSHVFNEFWVLGCEGAFCPHFIILVNLFFEISDEKIVGELVVVW